MSEKDGNARRVAGRRVRRTLLMYAVARIGLPRLAATLAASAICTVAMATFTAAPASAATPYCNTRISLPMVPGTVVYLPASGTTYMCQMYQGAGPNNGVRALQNAINVCYIDSGAFTGHPRLVEDGEFGPKTKAALMAVQQYYRNQGANIAVDGGYGRQTYNVMNFPGTGTDGGCWWPALKYRW